MSAACQRCGDTGREGSSDYLDCTAPGCDVAVTRTKLEAAVNAQMVEHGLMTMQDMIWFAHQMGKAAVLQDTPVAYAVTAERGGIHKLAITKESAERKAARWADEWPNNNCRVRPLIFGAVANNKEKT